MLILKNPNKNRKIDTLANKLVKYGCCVVHLFVCVISTYNYKNTIIVMFFLSLPSKVYPYTYIYIYKSLRKKNSDFLKKKLNNMSDCSDAVKDGNCFFVKEKKMIISIKTIFFYRVVNLFSFSNTYQFFGTCCKLLYPFFISY